MAKLRTALTFIQTKHIVILPRQTILPDIFDRWRFKQ